MKIRLSILILCLCSGFAWASAQKARIYGYVIGPDNRGIEAALIYAEESQQAVNSNRNGYYDLNIEAGDSVTLVYSMSGYKTIRRSVKLNKRIMQITVELPFLSKEIAEVEVFGYRKQGSSLEMLDPSKLRLLPNTSGGIESLLITFSGVTSNNELSSQYNVRGGSYDENSVYVNGIEVYRPLLIRSAEQEGLSFVNPDLVHSLAFSSGGFEARYGDKMSSALDIRYKQPRTNEAGVSMGLLGASAYVGLAAKKLSLLHGIRYKTSEYLLGSLDTKGEYSPSFLDYQTYLTYRFSSRWELSFLGNFARNSYRFRPSFRQTSFGTYTTARQLNILFKGWEQDLFHSYFGAFTLKRQSSDKLELALSASAYHTDEKVSYDITGNYWLNEKKMDLGLSENEQTGELLGMGKFHEHARNSLQASVVNLTQSGSYRPTTAHKLQWGLTAQWERVRDRMNEWEWRDSVGYSLPLHTSQLHYNLRSDQKISSFRALAYLQDSYKWETAAGRWTFIGGLRANYWSFNRELLISPRVSLALFPYWQKDFSFRLATGLYYQAPFYKELRSISSDALANSRVHLNSNIRAQRSWHLVLGGDHYFRAWGRPFKATAEAYAKLIDRAVSYTVSNVDIRYSGRNDSRAFALGTDLKLFGELVPGVDSWFSVSLMNSKEDLYGLSHIRQRMGKDKQWHSELVEWIPRPNEQRYVLSLVLQDYLPNNPKYKLQLKLIWADGLSFGVPGNSDYRSAFRSSPYRRADIGASRVFTPAADRFLKASWLRSISSLWINVEVLNLFDIRNTGSYYWITDLENNRMAAPNFLTGRLFNLKLILDFN